MPEDDQDFPTAAGAATHEAPRGFSHDQMVACDECLRPNPPTRMNCIYCGVPLPVTEASERLRRPPLKPLEEWEQGVNVILAPAGARRITPEATAEASALLRLEGALLSEMLEAGCALPLARAASDEEAELITARLGALGFGVLTLTDGALGAGAPPPVRIRGLEFEAESLAGRTAAGGERCEVAWAEVMLLVAGRVFDRRIEVEERQGKLGARGEVVDARELVSDEAVLDIYAAVGGEVGPWRITSESFDYTCLGARKGLLARDNFVTLLEELRGRAPGARFDDTYRRARRLLAAAWPPSEHTESGGLRRQRPGRFNTEAVTSVSNEAQFTRFSRMLHQLELRARAGER